MQEVGFVANDEKVSPGAGREPAKSRVEVVDGIARELPIYIKSFGNPARSGLRERLRALESTNAGMQRQPFRTE